MLRSREALEDAKKAFQLFKRQDIVDFHLTWVLCATLLGAVDEALCKYDLNKNSHLGDALKNAWEKERSNPLRKVGKDMRNEILHQYARHYEGEDVYQHDVHERGVFEARAYRKRAFKGDHPVEAIEQVIRWWEDILKKLEDMDAEMSDKQAHG